MDTVLSAMTKFRATLAEEKDEAKKDMLMKILAKADAAEKSLSDVMHDKSAAPDKLKQAQQVIGQVNRSLGGLVFLCAARYISVKDYGSRD